MRYSNSLSLLLIVLTSIWHPCLSFATETPSGWSYNVDGEKKTVIFRPTQSNSEIDILVKFYPAVPLNNKGVDGWLRSKLYSSRAPKGSWKSEEHVVRDTANFAHGHRTFTNPDGTTGLVMAHVFSADRQFVRLGIMLLTQNDKNNAYLDQATEILGNLVELEKASAIKEERGIDMESPPPKVKSIKAGGPIKPGRYIGSRTRNGKSKARYEIMLYENGEYEFLNAYQKKKRKQKKGHYIYSQLTGRLNIRGDFYNSTIYPKSDFCVYGVHRSTGKETIYARSDDDKYRLTWVNPPDRLSPSAREEAKNAAEAEAKRYKYVTNPGDGLSQDDIEAIIYTFDLYYGYGAMQQRHEAYLLTKDGRVMDGIPVAPKSLDVGQSRSREPDRWGWWKYDGKKYRFAWPADRNQFKLPRGTQMVAKPVPKGTKLDGTWGSTSSSTSLDFSSTSFWGVTLDKQGRFKKYRSSMMQGGGEITGGGGPMVTSISNDEGSATSVIGSNVGGGSSRKNKGSASHRMGSYEFDGYNLTLRYDNGRVKHLATFTTGDNYSSIWFENGDLNRK
ncbi:MAG: hypothetical protein ABW104_16085 [Candidatus Thiodiazotropha sp. 6PLUC2]